MRILGLFLIAFASAWGDGAPNNSAGSIRGVVHDPQHRALQGAQIVVQCQNWAKTLASDSQGEFQASDVPLGTCELAVSASGFGTAHQTVAIASNRSPVLHLQLELATVNEVVQVSGELSKLNAVASTTQTLVSAKEIETAPGASLTNSLAMITDFTPGAYMVHDMLHLRGGHQVNWFFDDIPVINTNIAANVAPLINPKDIADLEVQRGGYSSEYGDRTYGFFNVVTPSGFERDNQAEIILSAGNFYSTDDQFNVGSHTQQFAYYASVDGNRSDLGLATPTSEVIHDQASGIGGLVSLLYNPSVSDQFRWIVSLRENHYQIPNDPDAQAAGIRDVQSESDYLAGFHWAHSFSDGILFTLAPYFHFNSADFKGGQGDTPFVLNNQSHSNYFGARSAIQVQKNHHDGRAGIEIWAQHDDTFFDLAENPGSGVLNQHERNWAQSESLFLEDSYKVSSWLTLNAGVRLQHYGGLVNENAFDPRVGGAIRIPKLHWTVHGYYAYYYQPPPLDSLAGPSLDFALEQGYGFIPLAGERDIQHDIGLTIPLRGWTLDADQFHTSAKNFLDHDVIGTSGIFIPLSDLGAKITGTEVTLRSPRLFGIAQIRGAYSNQLAEGVGPITGGLLQDSDFGTFVLDHDQRNTLSAVLSLNLPRQWWSTAVYQFGSGFLDGDGPGHLPNHSTFDLSLGKHFGEQWSFAINAMNVGNARYLLDNSNTFGGTHYVNPRQVYAEVRYRFHF
ncbi:MAG TPA: TonB-dependent receptor [Bryobacteraceae bacterium]|nr:TonB-dependent receptor [Bryobacteraceae bacterium]